MSFADQLREEVEAVPIEADLIGGHIFPSGKGVTEPGTIEDRLANIEFALGALRQGLDLTGRRIDQIEERLSKRPA